MEAAFTLEAEKPQLFFFTDFMNRLGRVIVADAFVAMFPQWVVGEIVLRQIAMHVAVTPVCDRVDLPAIVRPLEKWRVLAAF